MKNYLKMVSDLTLITTLITAVFVYFRYWLVSRGI